MANSTLIHNYVLCIREEVAQVTLTQSGLDGALGTLEVARIEKVLGRHTESVQSNRSVISYLLRGSRIRRGRRS